MVCTGAWLHTGLGFTLKRVCEPGSIKEGTNCRTRDNKLKRETSRRPNFFIFRPIEVLKEPRQGFWDAGKPLEQSVCHFEHCKTCF
jgi:hypothetical protein